MKNLKQYIKEKLIVFHPQIDEKLVVNKNYKNMYLYKPNTWDELRQIIVNRFEELGPGTKSKSIDFNDIDVSGMNTLYNKSKNFGIFERTKFEYIDISDWDVSNVRDMHITFWNCKNLRSVGDLSGWNVSNDENISFMFAKCEQLESIGDLSRWNVSNIEDMVHMFYACENLKSVGNISKWNITKVKNMQYMFTDSAITNIPSWYKE